MLLLRPVKVKFLAYSGCHFIGAFLLTRNLLSLSEMTISIVGPILTIRHKVSSINDGTVQWNTLYPIDRYLVDKSAIAETLVD